MWRVAVLLCSLPALYSYLPGLPIPSRHAVGRRSEIFAVLSKPDGEQAKPRRRVAEQQTLEQMQQLEEEADQKKVADGGFVFGRDSVTNAIAALERGELVLLTEDGNDETSGSLLVSPGHVTEEQLQFLLEHTMRPQIALVRAATPTRQLPLSHT